MPMRLRTALTVGCLGVIVLLGVLRAQRPFKEYPAIEYEDFALPSDWKEPHDWVRARLRYPDIFGYPDNPRFRMRDGQDWPGQWTMDYPRSDRHLLQGVRRLTRIDTRSVEQIVDLDGTNDVYNWPLMYAVEVGHWLLPRNQANQLREYLLRGGFLMVDDFHGSEPWRDYVTREPLNEWQTFVDSMKRVFPDREIQDIPDDDPIFHTIYDLQDRFQVPGAQIFRSGITYEKGQRERCRIGAAFATKRAASWLPSATTWTWAMPGNGLTTPNTTKNGRHWLTASPWIISFTI